MTRELELHNRRRLDCSAERRRQTFAFSGCAVHRCRVAVAPRTGAELGRPRVGRRTSADSRLYERRAGRRTTNHRAEDVYAPAPPSALDNC